MKTIIITGASDGLGKSVAELLIRHGNKVVNISRHSSDVPGIINIKCDLAKQSDIDSAISVIKEKYSDFDVLINNAAIVGYSETENIDYQKLDSAFKINTVAPLYLTSRLLELIKKNGADVINIGTTHSAHNHPGAENQLAYCASKYGLRGGSYNLSNVLKNTKARLVHIYMGGFNSKMHEKDYGNILTDPENWMKTSDLADIILYLINLPKQIEISEITINRKGRRG